MSNRTHLYLACLFVCWRKYRKSLTAFGFNRWIELMINAFINFVIVSRPKYIYKLRNRSICRLYLDHNIIKIIKKKISDIFLSYETIKMLQGYPRKLYGLFIQSLEYPIIFEVLSRIWRCLSWLGEWIIQVNFVKSELAWHNPWKPIISVEKSYFRLNKKGLVACGSETGHDLSQRPFDCVALRAVSLWKCEHWFVFTFYSYNEIFCISTSRMIDLTVVKDNLHKNEFRKKYVANIFKIVVYNT